MPEQQNLLADAQRKITTAAVSPSDANPATKPNIKKRPSSYNPPSESSTNAMPQGTFTNGRGKTSTTESNTPRTPAIRIVQPSTYLPSRGVQILSAHVNSAVKRSTIAAKSFTDAPRSVRHQYQ